MKKVLSESEYRQIKQDKIYDIMVHLEETTLKKEEPNLEQFELELHDILIYQTKDLKEEPANGIKIFLPHENITILFTPDFFLVRKNNLPVISGDINIAGVFSLYAFLGIDDWM